jgi:16S rRNA A1518/A1519 N6-dimethyltransferase RsmA/KsgA/DIM1 with predicted DNA glycosylase/AP lyase activity
MHLPISFSDKTSHNKKLLYQADFINETINRYNYSNILELGCGMGFNTNYLAKKSKEKVYWNRSYI